MIKAVKGTRDFYPQEMRVLNYLVEAWRKVSLRNGFEEYDAPIFEYLDLLAAKSGPEIASQLFSFTDRGGRQLASVAREAGLQFKELQQQGEAEASCSRFVGDEVPIRIDQRPTGDQVVRVPFSPHAA